MKEMTIVGNLIGLALVKNSRVAELVDAKSPFNEAVLE